MVCSFCWKFSYNFNFFLWNKVSYKLCWSYALISYIMKNKRNLSINLLKDIECKNHGKTHYKNSNNLKRILKYFFFSLNVPRGQGSHRRRSFLMNEKVKNICLKQWCIFTFLRGKERYFHFQGEKLFTEVRGHHFPPREWKYGFSHLGMWKCNSL